jgi:hypothetical protein
MYADMNTAIEKKHPDANDCEIWDVVLRIVEGYDRASSK